MKNLVLAKQLCTELINEMNERYNGTEYHGTFNLCMKEWSGNDSFCIQPTNHDTFHTIDDFIKVGIGCNCSTYVTIDKNDADNVTPTLVFI